MKTLERIEKGEPGWRKRANQITLLAWMAQSNTPRHCWDVYHRACRWKRQGNDVWLGSPEPEVIGEWMAELLDMGYLTCVGIDNQCGWRYSIAPTDHAPEGAPNKAILWAAAQGLGGEISIADRDLQRFDSSCELTRHDDRKNQRVVYRASRPPALSGTPTKESHAAE